ncbi:MAG: glutamate formimidoyltransferase [Nitrospinae bacterium]|nr:glutamate formimidoyltransferase [Nitrospinota bacterium]
MERLVECVPNFSEGRREEVIVSIASEIEAIQGVILLDRHMDVDHNRSVLTFIAPPQEAKEGAFLAIKKASELINMNKHKGEHPRIGATDVVPFVPLRNTTIVECVILVEELGEQVGRELGIPVYLYGDAARTPERKDLAKIRRGEFEGLKMELGKNPERIPDYGPNRIHETAGATVIGARPFLVAYNVNLLTEDIDIAKRIARSIRESSGGFKSVKAMGFKLHRRGMVQVSMNLVNYTHTSIKTVFKEINRQAEALGVEIAESEIVGLVPRDALLGTTPEQLKVVHFSEDKIIENRIKRATI